MQIVKFRPSKTARERHKEFVDAMWLQFLLQNANPMPEADGAFYLGEISGASIEDQRIERWNPYATARGLR